MSLHLFWGEDDRKRDNRYPFLAKALAVQLQLRLLGTPQIIMDGSAVEGVISSKAWAILYYLAVAGSPQTRSVLAELLWGDMPNDAARTNLRQTLVTLRRSFEPVLETDRHTVAWQDEITVWVDVTAFEGNVGDVSDISKLQAAVELYQADFLTGVYIRNAPEFEAWMLGERARLREIALQTLQHLIAHHGQQNDPSQAIAYTRRLLALEPWREEAHRQLMRLLAQNGQHGAALAQYEICRQVLADELAIEPGPETVALYERIRYRLPPPEEKASQGSEDDVLPPVNRPPFLTTAPQPRSTIVPFVRRRTALAQLEAFLDQALASQGRIVFITGESGIGKTTLIREFARRAQMTHPELIVANGNCAAYTGAGDPYLPFRDILSMLTGDLEHTWATGEVSQEQAYRLWRCLPHTVQAIAEYGPNLIDTLVPGLPLRQRVTEYTPHEAVWSDRLQTIIEQQTIRPIYLDPSQFLEQITRVLNTLAAQQPLLLLLDDLQWIDEASINLLFRLGRRISGSRVLLVGTYRPSEIAQKSSQHPLLAVVNEFKRQFGEVQIDLDQLDSSEGRAFVDAYLDSEPNRLGEPFRAHLFHQTKGHPLFTIELLRDMQERGNLIQDEAGRWIEGTLFDPETLPSRVEAVIKQRLERLGDELQNLLTIASVEGETFTAEVIAQVLVVDEQQIIRQLSRVLDRRYRLVQSWHNQQLGANLVSCYRFRHILFQTYLYNRLDEAERRYLHQAIGNALEQLYGAQAADAALKLAHHFQLAGLVAKAVDYLRLAGMNALQMYAYAEAIDHFNRGLDLLKTLADTSERDEQELALLLLMGPTLGAVKGNVDPQVEAVYARAYNLCQRDDQIMQRFLVFQGLYTYYGMRGIPKKAHQLAEQALHLAQDSSDLTLLKIANFMVGNSLFFMGALSLASTYLERSLALPLPDPSQSALQHGYNPILGALLVSTIILWLRGYPDQALARSYETLTQAEAAGHPFSLAWVYGFTALFHSLRREHAMAQEQAEKMIALSTKLGFLPWVVFGQILQEWALTQQKDGKTDLPQMEQGVRNWVTTGTTLMKPYFLVLLAEACGADGQIAEGLALLTEALADIEAKEERLFEAEVYRLKGLLLWQAARSDKRALLTDDSSPEANFLKAIAVARKQSAKALELRAVINLSQVWQQQGKHKQARQRLSKIYGWFSKGVETTDLREARTLLEAMS